MGLRRKSFALILRLAVAGAIAILAAPSFAQSALLPAGFFDNVPPSGPDKTASVESDTLAFDGNTGTITASGNVIVRYEGYEGSGDRLVFNQGTGEMTFDGNVRMRDPQGIAYTTNHIQMTGGFKKAILDGLTLRTPAGTLVTAESVDYGQALQTIMLDTMYSPCGDCIDSKGRRIGWQVFSKKVTYVKADKKIYLEQSRLELLGMPMAWIPWLALNDPTQPAKQAFRTPRIAYGEKYGAALTVPYSIALDENTDLFLLPTLTSRQGLMAGAEWIHRFENGEVSVQGQVIKQADPGAFGLLPGNRDWRGSIQTSGRFTPTSEWTWGWNYTAFTDPYFLTDYDLVESKNSINELYATYLTKDQYADVRVQRFNLLESLDQGRQATLLPNARYEGVLNLGNGLGQATLTSRLIGLQRERDDLEFASLVPYNFGYAGTKAHAVIQGAWQNQVVGPAGVLFTPYLGLRADGAYYNGGSILPAAPDEQSLFSLTPIAAMDVRWPLLATAGSSTHIVEPIGQLVYRGSNNSLVGITNDDAQSFVFDDANLFSFNRFSGYDRQETGLRANVGFRYQADFGESSWIELLAGQSFHLAGTNAFASPDAAQVGNPASSGMGADASYAVLGARAALWDIYRAGAKVQLDPAAGEVTRASAIAGISNYGYAADLEYVYLRANPTLGVPDDQHEIGAIVGAPVPLPWMDYWRVRGGLFWDLTTNQWLEIHGGLSYDDGYLAYGANVIFTGPTASTANDTRFLFSFALKGPDGANFAL